MKTKKIKRYKLIRYLLIISVIIIIGMIIPEQFSVPVEGATKSSYNQKSFWYYPWGKSVTHKGVDIFANEGTPVYSATDGIVIYRGEIEQGGNVIAVLGPKWRIHYYAHLESINARLFSFVGNCDTIAYVGTSGNAQGKEPHLHYSILSIIPRFWKISSEPQGWKKMFYVNPVEKLNQHFDN